jgi:hypothetical protein
LVPSLTLKLDLYAYKEIPGENLWIIAMSDEKIVIKTKHGELSLEQLAEAQHGMAHLMKEVGERYHVLYYSAKALNWKLAHYQLNQVIALFKIGATLRPKFTEDLNNFVKTHFHPIGEAIRAQDWKRFEEAFKKGIEASDRFHEKYGYGFIHFVLPKNPPEMYDLAPKE